MKESMDSCYTIYEDVPVKKPVVETLEIATTNWQLRTEVPAAPESTRKKCGEVFVEPDQTYILICSMCSKQYSSLESFGIHVNIEHLYELEAGCKPFEILNVDEVAFTSDDRGFQQDVLQSHETNVEPELCPIPQDSTETNEIFSCTICGNKYKHKRSYNKHVKIHHGIQPSGKRKKRNVKKDISTPAELTKVTKFACTLCNKSYTRKRQLRTHVRLIHELQWKVSTPDTNKSEDQIDVMPAVSSVKDDSSYSVESPLARLAHQKCSSAVDESSDMFSCSLCNCKYKHRQSYNKHLRNRHGITASYLKEKMSRQVNEEHSQIIADEDTEPVENSSPMMFTSPLRDETFSQKDQLVTHSQPDDEPEVLPINSPFVHPESPLYDEDMSENMVGTKLTISFVNEDSNHTVVPDEMECSDENDDESKDTFPCSTCGLKYKHNSCKEHLTSRHDIAIPTKEEMSNEDASGEDSKVPPFTCTLCQQSYRTQYRLGVHTKLNHGLEAYMKMRKVKCLYCTEIVSKLELNSHIQSQHPGDRKYACSHCDKLFKTRSGRRRHSNMHKGLWFQCPYCPKVFTDNSNLSTHVRIHLQIRNHPCRYCDKRFITTSDRKSHERVHTGEKPMQCDLCGKCFSNRCILRIHILRHKKLKNYKCDVCEKAFCTSTMLKEHKQGHSTERPYICSVCGQSFARVKTLRMHEKLHLDVKKYVCSICGKAFAQCAGLYSHRKSHGDVKCNLTEPLKTE